MHFDKQELADRFHPKRYNYYGRYLKDKFGRKVFKVIVDAGFTCPNRDGSKGYGGCSYCNVDSFTPRDTKREQSIRDQVIDGIERSRRSYGAEKFIVYFQPNTNTYSDVDTLEQLYREAIEAVPDEIVGLTIGTRPDCIDREKLEMLKERFGHLYVSIEYGMESINDTTLSRINRGIGHQVFIDAVELTAAYGFEVCAHTIFGLPGDTEKDWMRVADELNRLPIRFAKLHHLHIVRGSILAKQYKEAPFELFSLDSYTDFLCRFLPRLHPDIVVQRLFGISDFDDLIAPDWGLRKTLIQRHIEQTLADRGVVQGSECSSISFGT